MDPRLFMTDYATGQGFIDPSTLQLQPQSPRHIGTTEFVDSGITTGYIESYPLKDGQEYVLCKPPRRNPAPIEFMDGTWQNNMEKDQRLDSVLIVPRSQEHTGKPSLPTISFSIAGNLGPYLFDLRQQRVVIDKSTDMVFLNDSCQHWKQTTIRVDWARDYQEGGILKEIRKMSRGVLAFEVACIVYDLFEKLARKNRTKQRTAGAQIAAGSSGLPPSEWLQIQFKDVRLLGLSYYRNRWVPILAIPSRNSTSTP